MSRSPTDSLVGAVNPGLSTGPYRNVSPSIRSSFAESSPVRIGAHVSKNTLLAEAEETGSEVVQIFLSSNRSWAPPVLGEEFLVHARELQDRIYVHAPYLVNPASLDPLVRKRSRDALLAQFTAAERIGALGVVVHGGHLAGAGSFDDGVQGWLEVLADWGSSVPLLIENTAGGTSAMARSFDDFKRLFDALSTASASAGHRVGVCLDTCHAWAGGEALGSAVARLSAFAGRIDLLHVNDSRDLFDSGRDRHANLGDGTLPSGVFAEILAAACCDAVVETPNGPTAMASDVEFLRSGLRDR